MVAITIDTVAGVQNGLPFHFDVNFSSAGIKNLEIILHRSVARNLLETQPYSSEITINVQRSMPVGTRKRLKPQKHSDVVEQAQRVMAEARELVKERCSLVGKFNSLHQEAELHVGSILSGKVD